MLGQTELGRSAFLEEVREHIGAEAEAVEVGVLTGLYSSQILRRLSPRILHLVDPWERQSRREYSDFHTWTQGRWNIARRACERRLQKFSDRVVFHQAKSIDIVEEFGDGSLDFVYLDGNHRYSSVLEDLEAWVKKVRRGGILAGHDFGFSEEDAAHMHPDVRRAVREFCASMGYTFFLTRDNNQSYYFEV